MMMPIEPSKTGLCEIFRLLACKTWRDIGDSLTHGIALGEESITDYLLLSLKRAAPREIIVNKFSRVQEGRTTGADWEWWFVHNGRGFGMRVQAKRLNPKTLKYEGLDHSVRGSRRKQINLLINDAKNRKPPLYPAYCFYNYVQHTSPIPRWHCGTFPPDHKLFGCTVADAHAVRSLLRAGRNGLCDIGTISFPWSCLVCCESFSKPDASLPDRVHRVLVALSGIGAIDETTAYERSRVPGPVEALPDYVAKAIDLGEGSSEGVEEFMKERPIDGLLIISEKRG